MTEPRDCPSDELLIGFVEGVLPDPDRSAVEQHLATCDECIETVRCVHARLRAVAGALPPPPQAVAKLVRIGPAPSTAQTRVPILLRLPILVPVSLAAGVLLVVGAQTWLLAPPPVVLKRAAQMQRTTHATPVRARPEQGAEVLARVNAGEMVEVRAEQAGWCRITLPSGDDGWLECRVLE